MSPWQPNGMRRNSMFESVSHVLYGSPSDPPPIVDVPCLNRLPLYDGCPVMFDPCFEYKSILHNPDVPEQRFIGWERVRLRWMKPGTDGKLVPKET